MQSGASADHGDAWTRRIDPAAIVAQRSRWHDDLIVAQKAPSGLVETEISAISYADFSHIRSVSTSPSP